MNPIKVLFLGTPEFSKKCLESLFQDAQFKIQAVWTRPDAPSGRGLKLRPSPVKKWAAGRSIPVWTPQTLKEKKSVEFIKQVNIDVVVVVGYGLILPRYFLNWFLDKAVNIHTSLLPRWRGAAPVPHCLLAGDSMTGATLQKISAQLDAGGIIHQLSFPILSHMSSEDVYRQMEEKAVDLLTNTLPLYLKGQIQAQPQDESKAVYAPKIQKSQLRVNWSCSALKIMNSIRAFACDGGMHAFYKEKRVKIFQAQISPQQGGAGCILDINEKGILVACRQDSLYLQEVQLAGKKRQPSSSFIRGFQIEKGQKFE